MARNSKRKQYLALGQRLAKKKKKDAVGKRISQYSKDYVQGMPLSTYKRKLQALKLNYGNVTVEKRMKELLGLK